MEGQMKVRIGKFFRFFQAARTVDEGAYINPIDARGNAVADVVALEMFRGDGDRVDRGWIDPSRPDGTE
jgi:hypothetical protein